MRRALALATAATLALIAASPLAMAQSNGAKAKTAAAKPPTAIIPFEAQRAEQRGDKLVLRLNDDATVIPSKRIREVPIVDGRMGEHAELDGVKLYFPFGRIVSAQTTFEKFRDLGASMGPNNARFVPDPNYGQVAHFDRVLGTVCATETVGQYPVQVAEMRINRDKAISYVLSMPGPKDPSTGEETKAYHVVSVMEAGWLEKLPQALRMHKDCQAKLAAK